MTATLKLGTRGSPLALFQAHEVAGLLHSRAGVACDIVVIKTSGDRLAEALVAEIGGKHSFVKEIEDALLGGTIDLAVHSSKDLPAVLQPGLAIGAVLPREDARDAVVLPHGERTPVALEDIVRRLGRAPRIGTGSVRRTAQLTRLFPGARFAPIRGNLDTRLRKLDTGEFDAIILAAAGLIRLGHERRISAVLPPEACVPAPGQGIIAVEIRGDDTTTHDFVKTIDDPVAAAVLTAERTVVARLGGGCQTPIGAYAVASEHGLALTAIVVSVDGARTARTETRGSLAEAARVGAQAADELLARGAADILADADRVRAAVEGRRP
ncbi:MAG: hydroxymethylbilane synthase [Acidobacteria bacterium]|nr:hydroxymethylbilane synthase [Acidobacteriota bacterium]